MDKKILFFDYDGTLVDEQEGIYEISPATRAALLTLKQNGHYTFLATGRSNFYVPEKIKELFSGILSCNGAAVHFEGKLIFKQNIQNLDVAELCTFLEENNICGLLEQDDACIETPWNKAVLYKGLQHFNIRTDGYLPMPTDTKKIKSLELCKCILFFETEKQFNALCEKYCDDFELRAGKGGFFYLDFNQKGVTKALGAVQAMQYLNIDKADTFAFGDGENDVELLGCVANGVAMGKHSPLLEKAASTICETVKDEGICKSLIRFGLLEENFL